MKINNFMSVCTFRRSRKDCVINMKTLIFFDTNFIRGAKPNKIFVDKLVKNNIFPYTSELIIAELKGQKNREFKEKYDQLKTCINDCKYYFKVDLNVDSKRCYQKIDNAVEIAIQELFEDRVIKKDSNANMMETLLERNKFKLRPFVANNSDKGWMDTLIWTNFLEYCKNSSFEKYVFATSDGGFTKHTIELKKEFEENINNSILEIIDFKNCQAILTYFQLENVQDNSVIGKGNEENDCFIQENIELNEDAKRVIDTSRLLIGAFTTTEVDETYGEFNFRFYADIDIETGQNLLDEMTKCINDYLFFPEINMNGIFSRVGIRAEVKHTISKDVYLELVKMWNLIKSKHSTLVVPFLKYFINCLNYFVIINKTLPDDLPF